MTDNQNRLGDGTFTFQQRAEADANVLATTIDHPADDPQIAGYTYQAENHTPRKLIEVLIAEGRLSPGARGMTAEEALNQLAEYDGTGDGFDREDERSFDSDDFPKVILEWQVGYHDYDWLGREYWQVDGYDSSPSNAEDALQEWMDTEEIDFYTVALAQGDGTESEEELDSLREQLFQFTDRENLSAEENIKAIQAGADYLNIDLEALGYPLPTKHN